MRLRLEQLTNFFRRLTIEEVSFIFDTGRLGNASAAAAEFQTEQKDHGSDANPKTAHE